MAKTFLGEISFHIGRRRYTLRPTLEALYEIEQKLNTPLPSLIRLIRSGRAPARLIRFILQEGIKAHDAARRVPPLGYWRCRRLWPLALAFLVQGMGFLLVGNESGDDAPGNGNGAPQDAPDGAKPAPHASPDETPRAATSALSFEPLPWEQLYDTATVLLGLSEAEFWRTTMPGLSRMAAALARANGAANAYAGLPATRGDLEAMMTQFPDSAAAQAGLTHRPDAAPGMIAVVENLDLVADLQAVEAGHG